MEPITLRLPSDLLEALDTEAEDAGFSSRSEYIRHLLLNRGSIDQVPSSDHDQASQPSKVAQDVQHDVKDLEAQITGMATRISELENKMEQVRAELDSQNAANQADEGFSESPNTSDESIPSNQKSSDMNAGVETDSEEDAAVFSELDQWLREYGTQSEDAHNVMLSAARILDDRGPLAANDLKEELFSRHPDAYSSARTLWGSTVERMYQDAPGFEKPEYGTYSFNHKTLD